MVINSEKGVMSFEALVSSPDPALKEGKGLVYIYGFLVLVSNALSCTSNKHSM